MNSTPTLKGGSLALSIGAHLVVVAALLLGLWEWHAPPPPLQRLAIEATLVDPSSVQGLAGVQLPEPQAVAPAPEVAPQPALTPPVEPPAPKPDERIAQEKAQREQAEKVQKAEQARKAKAAADKASNEKVVREKAAQEKAVKDKAAKEKTAKEQTEKAARDKAEKERKDKADREKALRDKALAEEKTEAERQKAVSESQLRARLAAEEQQLAAQASARNSAAMAQYQEQIRARIERAWIRPASARTGLRCEVRITQVPGGEVVGVKVGACNGDESVRQSIEAAAYRASPLPLPPDPALFDRNLVVTFRPQD
jgi:colicin import membrane protein